VAFWLSFGLIKFDVFPCFFNAAYYHFQATCLLLVSGFAILGCLPNFLSASVRSSAPSMYFCGLSSSLSGYVFGFFDELLMMNGVWRDILAMACFRPKLAVALRC
jgi:hypothetical protein